MSAAPGTRPAIFDSSLFMFAAVLTSVRDERWGGCCNPLRIYMMLYLVNPHIELN